MNLVKRLEVLESRSLLRTVPAERVEIDSPADVLALIEEQVNSVRADVYAEPTERARTLGFLASLALRAMASRDILARLEAEERVLKLREKAPPLDRTGRLTIPWRNWISKVRIPGMRAEVSASWLPKFGRRDRRSRERRELDVYCRRVERGHPRAATHL